MIYTTFPDRNTAEKMASKLLDEKYVACANISPIGSMYWWESGIEKEDEWVAILKTIPELLDRVEKLIITNHPYDVPCIAYWEAEANSAYESWIRDSVSFVEGAS